MDYATVYTNADGTGVRSNCHTDGVAILNSDTLVHHGTGGFYFGGYNSAIFFSGGESGVEFFLIFGENILITQYNNGATTNTYPDDSGNNKYGYHFVSTGTGIWNYIRTEGDIPIFSNRNEWLEYVTTPQATYTWQSVPSISGKNGILSLATLNDVNDGEPVETSDTSKFNLTDDSNVSALVAARLSE